MAGGDDGLTIVRTWTSYGAPTGEAGRHETADGRVWKDAFYPGYAQTGVTWGSVHGERMHVDRHR